MNDSEKINDVCPICESASCMGNECEPIEEDECGGYCELPGSEYCEFKCPHGRVYEF